MESESRRSPFYASAEAAGGTHMEEEGWFWLDSFGDFDGEYEAVRNSLGVWDVSPLNKWEFTGPDALEAAQRVHANNIAGLQVGQVRYGAFCDTDGLMIDDGTIYRLEDRVWVMTNGHDRLDHFTQAASGLDASIENITLNMPHLGIQGPNARKALDPVCGIDLTTLGYFRFHPELTTVGGVPCYVSRTGFGGELGYELFCAPEVAADLWDVVTGPIGARPYGVSIVETLRVEAGLVVLGYDYQEHEITPFDLSFDKMVALDGGEFLGRDALRSVADNPPNRFKTVVIDGDVLPDYGAEVTIDGRPVGTLTSPAPSPKFGLLGMAILETAVAVDGQRVEVALEDGTVGATVAPLSILDPEKRRPRAQA